MLGIAALVLGLLISGSLLVVLFFWRVAGDVRRRERQGTDPEDLNWRSRYFRGYPRD